MPSNHRPPADPDPTRSSRSLPSRMGAGEADRRPVPVTSPPPAAHEGPLLVHVEIPKGSRNTFEHDPATGGIRLDRYLAASMTYPVDYGYLAETWGADDDPLDAMVCVSEPTFPGCVIPARPVALLRMTDEHGPDDKLLCVPVGDPRWSAVVDLGTVPPSLTREIAHFFAVYKQPEGKPVTVDGWRPLDDALAVLAEARERFRARQVAR